MSTLQELKSEAEQATDWHGHKLGYWVDLPGGVSDAECEKCRADVRVTLHPRPNEINIAGLAVATACYVTSPSA